MANEIERKFFLKSLPSDIDLTSKTTYERHFLKIGPDEELRIQRKGDKYFLERKAINSKLSSTKSVTPISIEKFNELRQDAVASIERDSYKVSNIQNATIKVYQGRFEGLIRLEVEFQSVADATHFSPPDWSGIEITESDLGRDSKLVGLSYPEFRTLLDGIFDPKPS
jgi:CYTH domain-containing protein